MRENNFQLFISGHTTVNLFRSKPVNRNEKFTFNFCWDS